MKSCITVLDLLVLSLSAYAENIDNKKLISNMNYGMEALTVTKIQNKVQVISGWCHLT